MTYDIQTNHLVPSSSNGNAGLAEASTIFISVLINGTRMCSRQAAQATNKHPATSPIGLAQTLTARFYQQTSISSRLCMTFSARRARDHPPRSRMTLNDHCEFFARPTSTMPGAVDAVHFVLSSPGIPTYDYHFARLLGTQQITLSHD